MERGHCCWMNMSNGEENSRNKCIYMYICWGKGDYVDRCLSDDLRLVNCTILH